jgi:hypothetical protein
MNTSRESQRILLLRVARQEMLRRGPEPDFPAPALAEVKRFVAPGAPFESVERLLRKAATACLLDGQIGREPTRSAGSSISPAPVIPDREQLMRLNLRGFQRSHNLLGRES